MDKKISHLNMIQGIITRMGNNSFALKGWAVGIMIAVYAFAGNSNVKAVIVTLMPLVVFWFIDTYYLMLERKYRFLYDQARTDNHEIDFSMELTKDSAEKRKAKARMGLYQVPKHYLFYPFFYPLMIVILVVVMILNLSGVI